MNLVDIMFAFSAGLASLFAPCSFPLLTAYIPYYLRLDAGDRDEGLRGETIGTATWIWRGVGGGLTASLGAVSVFVILGALLGSAGRVIKPLVPGMEALVGGLLILLGLAFAGGPSPSGGGHCVGQCDDDCCQRAGPACLRNIQSR
ncbi:MAG: cytochrome c biogenesis protein CcdA [Anaerolineae bacterium]